MAPHAFLNSGGGAVVYPCAFSRRARIISGILPSKLLRIWFQNSMNVLVFFFFFFEKNSF